MVSSMVALVVASRYSKTVATFTKQNATKKSGFQLKLHLVFACYFIVPLCHWIWLYGGLQNRVVVVNMLTNLVNIKTILTPQKILSLLRV